MEPPVHLSSGSSAVHQTTSRTMTTGKKNQCVLKIKAVQRRRNARQQGKKCSRISLEPRGMRSVASERNVSEKVIGCLFVSLRTCPPGRRLLRLVATLCNMSSTSPLGSASANQNNTSIIQLHKQIGGGKQAPISIFKRDVIFGDSHLAMTSRKDGPMGGGDHFETVNLCMTTMTTPTTTTHSSEKDHKESAVCSATTELS